MSPDEGAALTAVALGRVLRVRRGVDAVARLAGLSVTPVLQSLDRQASSDDQVRVFAVVAMVPEDSVSSVTRPYPSLPSTVRLGH